MRFTQTVARMHVERLDKRESTCPIGSMKVPVEGQNRAGENLAGSAAQRGVRSWAEFLAERSAAAHTESAHAENRRA
jgi:hypothetical protein